MNAIIILKVEQFCFFQCITASKRCRQTIIQCISEQTTLSAEYGWMDDLQFYILFYSISVISGQCSDDNKRLCSMELLLRLRFHLE